VQKTYTVIPKNNVTEPKSRRLRYANYQLKAAVNGLKAGMASGAGTIFGQGGKTGDAKLMGSLSNLDRVFVPEISALQKTKMKKGLHRIWTASLSQK